MNDHEQQAYDLGAEHACNAASWVIDGNMHPEHIAELIWMLDNGEDQFEDYAHDLADDIGALDSDLSWPHNCIDWERAARELSMDYTTVTLDGVTYYAR